MSATPAERSGTPAERSETLQRTNATPAETSVILHERAFWRQSCGHLRSWTTRLAGPLQTTSNGTAGRGRAGWLCQWRNCTSGLEGGPEAGMVLAVIAGIGFHKATPSHHIE